MAHRPKHLKVAFVVLPDDVTCVNHPRGNRDERFRGFSQWCGFRGFAPQKVQIEVLMRALRVEYASKPERQDAGHGPPQSARVPKYSLRHPVPEDEQRQPRHAEEGEDLDEFYGDMIHLWT